ncbi:MAG TPA: helix-turn-helix domain-containing protein [Ktedonobacterales bacterium]|jgi:CRP-like cAMP-binding protein
MGEETNESKETDDLNDFFAAYPLEVYAPGECVVRRWELATGGIAWVRSGVLRVSAPARGGRDIAVCHLVAERYKMMVFGMAPFLRRYTVAAVTRVEAHHAPHAAFLAFAAHHPNVYRALVEDHLRRISDLYDQLWAAKLGDATQRVAAMLLCLCVQAGESEGGPGGSGGAGEGGMTLTYPLTQREVADLTGLSRETVGTALATLYRKGLVTHSGRTLRIEHMVALRAEVERST